MTKTNKRAGNRTDYLSISSMQELREAQLRLKGRILLKKAEMNLAYGDLRQGLDPMTYVNRALARIKNLDTLFLAFRQGYDWAAGFLQKIRDRKAARHSGALPDENEYASAPENGPAAETDPEEAGSPCTDDSRPHRD